MQAQVQDKSVDTIERVVAYARENLAKEKAELAEVFIRQYYGQVAPEELAQREIADLFGAAMAHLNFMEEFKSGAPKLRIYNPQHAKDGWQSTHTVIEIVNDDMPFLVDSVTMEIIRRGITLHLTIHPVMKAKRDADSRLQQILPSRSRQECTSESLMHLQIDRETDSAKLAELETAIIRILGDLRKAVEDYPKMRNKMKRIVAELKTPYPPGLDPELVDEVRALLTWLANGHFTFLGCRDYNLINENGQDVLRVVPGSGLGILRETKETKVSKSFATATPEVRKLARVPQLLIVTKANSRSTVHRPGYLDYIGLKRIDANGRVQGEHRFLGLFTSKVYNSHPEEIPLLRRRVSNILARAGFDPRGHLGKSLVTVLEEHPRDELFQRSEDELLEDAIGIMQLGYRQKIRLFVRSDVYGRFLSCLVYVPREIFGTELRLRIQDILMRAFNGTSLEFAVNPTESALVRLHVMVRTTPGSVPAYDVREIEKQIIKVSRRWEDDFHDALIARFGEERGKELFKRFGKAFPLGYQDDYTLDDAVSDTAIMATLGNGKDLAMNFYADEPGSNTPLQLIVFHAGEPMPLSTILPMLEHMGVKVLEQLSHKVEPAGMRPIYLSNFGMQPAGGIGPPVAQVKASFEETFARAWRGETESDDFNRLVLRANLGWREITVLRAYSKYLRQAGSTFSQAYMEQALSANASIAAKLVDLFFARFNPPAEKRERSRRSRWFPKSGKHWMPLRIWTKTGFSAPF
jgi:glutamate dehydrogenase